MAVCRQLGLLAEASVAFDGRKFKAVNNRPRNFTAAEMARRMAQIEQSVARYLDQLDSADRQERSLAQSMRTTRLKEKIVKLGQEMRRLAALDAERRERPDQQISRTDPDARSMATSGRGNGTVGCNVPAGVDREHHLIVAHEVTNVGNDRARLAHMAKQTKATLKVDQLDVVADRGYFASVEILACEEAGITVTLPKPMTSGSKVKGRFVKADFRYLADQDVYICPAGEPLKFYHTNEENGLTLGRYWTNACRTCAIKDRCTTGVQRRITRWQHEPCSGGRAAAAGRDPTSHAPAPRDGRASLWHDQGADRGNALSDEAIATRRDRDGLARAGLQSHAGHEYLGYSATDPSNKGLSPSVRV